MRFRHQSLDLLDGGVCPTRSSPSPARSGAVFFVSQLFIAIVLSSAMKRRSPGIILIVGGRGPALRDADVIDLRIFPSPGWRRRGVQSTSFCSKAATAR